MNKKIGIIGTNATIKSGAYEKALAGICPDIKTVAVPCPLFVPLVENGFICRDDQIVRLVVRRYLSELKEIGVDTLILGCTHYPLLKDAISEFMGDGVELIDSGYETAVYSAKILKENNLLNSDCSLVEHLRNYNHRVVASRTDTESEVTCRTTHSCNNKPG